MNYKFFQGMLPTLRSLLTSAGGIAYGTGAGSAPLQLAPGTATQVLHGGATPSWSQIVNADVASGAAIAASKLAASTERYHMQIVSGVPTWALVPACKAMHNTTQSIGNGAVTTIALNVESFDPTGMHDNATNNSRLTMPIAGIYLITANVQWPTAAGTRQLKIQRNASQDIAYNWVTATTGGQPTHQNLSVLHNFAAADWVEMVVYQDSGGALNLVGDATATPYLAAFWIGPSS